jgi:hypothetical protein
MWVSNEHRIGKKAGLPSGFLRRPPNQSLLSAERSRCSGPDTSQRVYDVQDFTRPRRACNPSVKRSLDQASRSEIAITRKYAGARSRREIGPSVGTLDGESMAGVLRSDEGKRQGRGILMELPRPSFNAEDFRSSELTLDRIGPAQGNVEIADGRDEHREDGKAINSGADQECSHEVAVHQADDAVKGPERSQDRDQGDGV